jgi:hypothetical protein
VAACELGLVCRHVPNEPSRLGLLATQRFASKKLHSVVDFAASLLRGSSRVSEAQAPRPQGSYVRSSRSID